MKKVLITGANSYIGTTFENWIKENTVDMKVDTIDMVDGTWREKSFTGYDSVFHVAGIAHADVGKVTEEQKAKYYDVNTKLTIDCANKAKADGVKQFVFMSSIIVYGESAGIGKKKVITKDTQLSPANFYGDSKVKAEEGIIPLADNSFYVAVLRPPMIYGKNSKGNYPLLSKFARRLLFFPDVQNERSMLYVGNLCKFISFIIQNEENGIFFPQNEEYVKTSEMVQKIAFIHHKKVYMTKLSNWLLIIIGHTTGKLGNMVNKAFGNMVYDRSLSTYKEKYQIYNLEESIRLTEGVE